LWYSIGRMKAWLIIGLIGISFGHPFQKREDKGASQNAQKVTNQSPSPTMSPPPCCLPASSPDQTATANKGSYWKEAFGPGTLSNWFLVLVGIGAIISALCTLRVIRQQTGHIARQAQSLRYQTTHLRNSVAAAQRSADALIASERAWIFVDLERRENGFVMQTDSFTHYTTKASVTCMCTNHGKTPAWVTEIRAALVRLNSADSLDSLPEEPDLSATEQKVFIPRPVADEPITCKFDVSCNQEMGGRILVLYGLVRYRHMFSDKEVQTTFGYAISPDHRLIRLSGHPKYNENT